MDERGVDDFGGSKRGSRSFTEAMERFGFMEIPLSPLLQQHNTPPAENDVDHLFISPRDYGSRQAFLRSYTFTRADHPQPTDQQEEPEAKTSSEQQQRPSKSLLRLKAAAWAVVACNNVKLYRRARVLKDKMVIKGSQYLTHSVYCLRSPAMPRCLIARA